MNSCRRCGEAVPAERGRAHRYCSDDCRSRAYLERLARKAAAERDRRRAARQEKACKECAAPLPAGRSTYCSDDCLGAATVRRQAERTKLRYNAMCVSCGKPKDRRGRGVKMCTPCREKASQRASDVRIEASRRWRLRLQTQAAELKAADVEYREGQKWCKRCGEYRPVDDFPMRKNEGKPSTYCRPCQSAYNMERRLRLNFGMTWDDYEMLLVCQDYRCAICKGRPRKHMLAVDHDHKTGEIRGLLCSRCNHKLLGSANDDPARLRAAADYLEEYQPREVFGERRVVPGFDQTKEEGPR